MLSPSIAFRRDLLSLRIQYLKPLTVCWRSQKTQAGHLESQESLDGLRSFGEIPQRNRWRFMYDVITKTEGFTKPFKLLERLFDELGPIYKEDFTMRPSTTVHVIDPEDFEKTLRAEGKYPQRPILDFNLEHRRRRNYFPGLPNLQGEEWHRVRQTIAPKIMRPKVVEENIGNFNAVSKDAVASLVKLKKTCEQDDHMPDLEKELYRWSLEGMATFAFDTRLGLYKDPPPQEALEFTEAIINFFEISQQLLFDTFYQIASKYFDTPLFKKFLKNCDALLDIGGSFVNEKMMELKEMTEKGIDPAKTEVVPLLTYLLMKKDLTPEEVNGHVVDVVAGGVDTTSNSVLWWLYNLARFPEVQEKLYQEIESVLGEDDDVTPKHLAKLSYLKACLKESMRMTPSSPSLTRVLDQDVVLSGYHVPAKTHVTMELYSTTRSEKYFKEPLEFKPERWLRESKEVHPFSHLQFGFGPRMCLGRRVAELEMYVFICKLLQRFRVEYHHEPLEMRQKLLTAPDKPVKIKFVDRV